MIKAWKSAKFTCANNPHPIVKNGFVVGGLGLYLAISASPKGRRPARWCLVHLNTGHAVAYISGNQDEAMAVGLKIHAVADWTFEGLDGWMNMDPGLPDKVRAIATVPMASLGSTWRSDEQARQIGATR